MRFALIRKIMRSNCELLDTTLKNFCLLFENRKRYFLTTSDHSGTKKFHSQRGLSCHAEVKAIKSLIGDKNVGYVRNPRNFSKFKVVTFRACVCKSDSQKIVFGNGKPCLRCFELLWNVFKFRNVSYFSSGDMCRIVDPKKDEFNYSSGDRSRSLIYPSHSSRF